MTVKARLFASTLCLAIMAMSCSGAVIKTPTPVTASTALTPDRGALVFSDDFTDSASGWTNATTSDFRASFSPSGYVIVAKTFLDHEAGSPYVLPKDQLSVSVTATESSNSPSGSGFGASCDRGLNTQTISYSFVVQDDSTWEMLRHDLRPGAANRDSLLKSGTSPKATGARSITVELMCATLSDGITTRLVTFVNSSQVADITDPLSDLPRLGWVGGLVVRSVDAGSTTVTATHYEQRDLTL
jgi:hypothetical protein